MLHLEHFIEKKIGNKKSNIVFATKEKEKKFTYI